MENMKDSKMWHTVDTVSLRKLHDDYVEKGEEFFKKAHAESFLMVMDVPAHDDEYDTIELKTKAIDISALTPMKGPNTDQVIELKKSDRNVFQSKITVGRAKNNDVVIRAPKISKLHAVFLKDGGKPSLVDRGSVNGTILNEAKLKPNDPVSIKSGDIVAFWRFVFMYLDVEGLIRLMKTQS
jgi:pSer/pThr/pTyr-binding forkhead associated (FHA) protein